MTQESTTRATDSAVGHLLRELAPQVLGAVARRHGDFAAAEDAVQEALIAAAAQWPSDGVPANPAGWLHHVAMRRLTDHVRSELARRRREETVASELWVEWAFVPPPDVDIDAEHDDTLVLLFMCCHSALTPASAIALTLRAVGGLTTAEIASAFLVPEATMAQRISRAKHSIKASGMSFSMPNGAERAERLTAVLHVLYLIFSEGYASSAGPDLHRADLSNEAIRLTRAVRALLPADAEVTALLALMLLTDARRAARTGAHGELIPLNEQDRTLWDRTLIDEGSRLVSEAMSAGPVASYQLQAAIAALHDEAAHPAETDWPQILALYGVLEGMSDNPMVRLNRAIAEAMTNGPAAGLELLRALDGDARMKGHHRLDAVRAHLLEMSGDCARAVVHYRAAANRTTSVPERDYLMLKAARLAAGALTVLSLLGSAACRAPGGSPGAPTPAASLPAGVQAISFLGDTLRALPLSATVRPRYERELAEARAAHERTPANVDSIIWLGRRLAYLGRFRDAIGVYTRGIALHPDDARLYRHRGHRYISVREVDRAVADLERATRLVSGTPDEVEPDGQPNARNMPIGTLHSNIAYHLGLAYYLRGDFARAVPVYERELAEARNDDRRVSTAHWLYMSLRRLDRHDEAAAVLAPVRREMQVVENDTYHRLLLMYKGELPPDSVLATAPGGEMSVTDATAAYGVGNWHLYSGRRADAERIFRRIIAGRQWGAFGFVAAEAELARMR